MEEEKVVKVVRIKDGIVMEVIPDAARPVVEWYNEAFAAQCVEAPDEVDQHWYYNAKTKTFRSPDEGPFLEESIDGSSSFETLLDALLAS